MKTIFIAQLNQDEVKILEAIPLSKEWSGKRLVKIIDTGFIYYERGENIGNTKEEAEIILYTKIDHLCQQLAKIHGKPLFTTRPFK